MSSKSGGNDSATLPLHAKEENDMSALKALRSRPAVLVVVATTLSLVLPAQACDPEDLAREYRSLCEVTHTSVRELAASLGDKINAETRNLVLAKADESKKLCLDDKYDEGMKLAMRAARLLGNSEVRQGLPGENFAAAASPVSVAQK
jgi:hypothetical protein